MALNQTVKRNAERFPDNFMFQLVAEEYESLRSQIVTLRMEEGSTENTYHARARVGEEAVMAESER